MALINMDYYSLQLLKTVHVSVILPAGEAFCTEEAPFKTVYFLPGFACTGNDIVTLFRMREYAAASGLAVVIPDGDNSFYHNRLMANYSSFIVDELISMTRDIFPLSRERKDTFLAGMSMGGFGTIYNGLKNCEKFGKLALLSPALDPYAVIEPTLNAPMFIPDFLDAIFGNYENFKEEAHYLSLFTKALEEKTELPEIIRACGDSDDLVGKQNEELTEFFAEHGIEDHFFSFPGGHENESAVSAVPKLLAFLAKES